MANSLASVCAILMCVVVLAMTMTCVAFGANGAAAQSASELYQLHCASCHGTIGQGTDLGPPLIGKSAADVHFMLDTGRMPANDSYVQQTHKKPLFSETQINQLTAYITRRLSHTSDTTLPEVGAGNVARGRELFAENCEQCHGAGGEGGAIGYGYNHVAPSLARATALQVAEAIRVGPGFMPRFGPGVLSKQDVNDIARYVDYLQTQNINPGGVALSNVGPVAEGFIAWFFGLGSLVLLIRRLGTTT